MGFTDMRYFYAFACEWMKMTGNRKGKKQLMKRRKQAMINISEFLKEK